MDRLSNQTSVDARVICNSLLSIKAKRINWWIDQKFSTLDRDKTIIDRALDCLLTQKCESTVIDYNQNQSVGNRITVSGNCKLSKRSINVFNFLCFFFCLQQPWFSVAWLCILWAGTTRRYETLAARKQTSITSVSTRERGVWLCDASFEFERDDVFLMEPRATRQRVPRDFESSNLIVINLFGSHLWRIRIGGII